MDNAINSQSSESVRWMEDGGLFCCTTERDYRTRDGAALNPRELEENPDTLATLVEDEVLALLASPFVTPQILGGNNELLLPQLIMLQVQRRADFPTASTLSVVLMVVVTVAYLASARWLKLERA